MRISQKHGFSLLEVLLSMLLISLALFGLDAMEFYTFKQTKIAYVSQIARYQLINIKERLSALKTIDSANTISIWNKENQKILPLGFGTVKGEFPNYAVTIYWGKQKHVCAENRIGESGCLKEKIHVV